MRSQETHAAAQGSRSTRKDLNVKAKIWVLSTVLADENGPAMPAVFPDESEARAKYDEVMRWEWDSMMDPDTDGPYPGDPDRVRLSTFEGSAVQRMTAANGSSPRPPNADGCLRLVRGPHWVIPIFRADRAKPNIFGAVLRAESG